MAVGLQHGDLLVQQIALDQRRTKLGIQPIALQSSPVAGFVVRAASPAARNASRQPLSVAAVTPRPRETVSRSSPRNNRSTAAVFRGRDILPPRPGDAAPDSRGRSASPGLASMFCCLSI